VPLGKKTKKQGFGFHDIWQGSTASMAVLFPYYFFVFLTMKFCYCFAKKKIPY
jgi:hypothetical protein